MEGSLPDMLGLLALVTIAFMVLLFVAKLHEVLGLAQERKREQLRTKLIEAEIFKVNAVATLHMAKTEETIRSGRGQTFTEDDKERLRSMGLGKYVDQDMDDTTAEVLAQVKEFIEQEEWNADFRDVLLTEIERKLENK